MSAATTDATDTTTDTTTDTRTSATTATEPAIDAAAAAEKNTANLKKIGALHFVMVMAALTLWGAADAWANASGWGLAWLVAMANAVIAGTVITGVLHEWGHYTGARLAGSEARVLDEPVRYYFMFDFSFDRNDTRQFVWMSLGGIVVPWLLVLATVSFVPIDNASRALLLAVFVARAVQVSLFEVPVVLRTRAGGEPRKELGAQLKNGFRRSRYLGFAAGALVWLAV